MTAAHFATGMYTPIETVPANKKKDPGYAGICRGYTGI